MWKTVLAVGLLIVSLVTLAVVVQIIGLWDWAGPLWEQVRVLPAIAPHVERYELGQEESARLAAREQQLAGWQAELEDEARALAEERRRLEDEELQLERRRQELARWEEQLAARESAVRLLEDEAAAMDHLRSLYAAMRPQEAARILVDLTDEEIAVILADMSPRQAGQILAALPASRAAEVSRRLGL